MCSHLCEVHVPMQKCTLILGSKKFLQLYKHGCIIMRVPRASLILRETGSFIIIIAWKVISKTKYLHVASAVGCLQIGREQFETLL